MLFRSCHVSATRAADANYQSMAASALVVTVAKVSATLAFDSTSKTVQFGAAFTGPTASTNSTASIVYSSSDTSVATVNSSTGAVTIVGVGSTTISAQAPTNANYLASPTVSYVLNVTAVPQSLTWNAATNGLTSKAFGDTFTIGATSTAGLTPTYSASGGCSISGNQVTMTSGVTNCVISAAQSGDRKSTRLNSSHSQQSRMPSSA